VTNDEEEAEVLNAFFASIFNSKTDCVQVTQPPELKDRDSEQNEAPIIQGEMVTDLLHYLDTHKSGAGWDSTKGTEGARGSAHQDTFNHLAAVLANQVGPS